jgi:type I restriction-modification system DNA methylase subunit
MSPFSRKLKSLSQRYNVWEVWTDFIAMFAIAISNCCDKAHREKREDMYLKIIAKYNKEERELFPDLAAEIITSLETNPEQDFLGKAYMELELNNHWIGQFFTPYSVCQCLAEITAGGSAKQISENGYVTLNDCACGAGATLIAGVHSIRRILEKNPKPLCWQNHILVTAQDIDFTTGLMCYIQLSLLGCAAYVKIGDTISNPMSSSDDPSQYWFTPMYFSDVWQTRFVLRHLDRVLRLEEPSSQLSLLFPDSEKIPS